MSYLVRWCCCTVLTRLTNKMCLFAVVSVYPCWVLNMKPLKLGAWHGCSMQGIIRMHTPIHCKNVWVTSTMFWSSQLHACCVRDTLQTSKGIFLFESKFEKLAPSLMRSSYKKPAIAIWLHTWHFYHNHAIRHSSRHRCVGTKKHQPHQKCYKPSERRY